MSPAGADRSHRGACGCRKSFRLKTRVVVTDRFAWTELERPGLRIGFAPARTMHMRLPRRRANTVVTHLTTRDVRGLMRRVARAGGKILFGPSRDAFKGRMYWCGAIADIEGNAIWIADLR